MGERAHFVLVAPDGGYELHYTHWGAASVALTMAAGPDAAVRYVRAQDRCEPATGWLDDSWCEGAALIDRTRHTLLLYQWTGAAADPRLRAAMIAVLRENWHGWVVRWGYGGLADVWEYLRDIGAAQVPGRPPGLVGDVCAPGEDDAGPYAVSVRGADGGLRFVALDDAGVHPAAEGPDVLERLAGVPATATWTAPAYAGLHVDVPERRIGWWLLGAEPAAPDVPERWGEDWTCEFWRDDWARHSAATGGAFAPPRHDTADAFDAIGRLVAADWALDREAWVDALKQRLAGDMPGVRFAPALDAYVSMPPSMAEQRACLAALHRAQRIRHGQAAIRWLRRHRPALSRR